MTRELPRVEVQPVVRHLNLVAVDDLLLEDAIAVAEAVTPSWVVERGKTVEEASSQATQATVTQSSVMLLLDDVLDTETELIQTS